MSCDRTSEIPKDSYNQQERSYARKKNHNNHKNDNWEILESHLKGLTILEELIFPYVEIVRKYFYSLSSFEVIPGFSLVIISRSIDPVAPYVPRQYADDEILAICSYFGKCHSKYLVFLKVYTEKSIILEIRLKASSKFDRKHPRNSTENSSSFSVLNRYPTDFLWLSQMLPKWTKQKKYINSFSIPEWV